MGGGVGGSVVDRSVGTLVWVRRRNGSWWPGRIVASEEVAAAHLLSHRSGTPIKLLGREDASVDWYNLDKSKRVKAFRCGEFDACIKKAEASLDAPTRKREKYARKQDAVIQALKLERQQFGHPQQFEDEPKYLNKINSGVHARELHSFPSDAYMVDDQPIFLKKLTNKKSTISSRNSVLSDDEENNSNSHQSSNTEKCSSTFALKEKNESKPFLQMNGLQTFDLSVAPPKKKFKFTDWEAAYEPPDDHENVPSTAEPEIGEMNQKERSQSGFNENSVIEKTCRQQQASSQVLLSSAHLPSFSSHKSDLQGEGDNRGTVAQSKRRLRVYVHGKSSDSEEDSEGSCKEMGGRETHFNSSSESGDETESDSSNAEYLEHSTGVNRHMAETSQTPDSRSDPQRTSTNQASENIKCRNNKDISTPSSSLSLYLQNHMSTKWNSKRKRNIHRKKRSFPSRQTYGNWRYPFPLQGDRDHSFIYEDEMGFRLVDVNIQVHQPNHRGEHVPWVSLSSKGNHGKPIVGHPIQVEVLEDASTLLDYGHLVPARVTKTGKKSAAIKRTRSDQQKPLKTKNSSVKSAGRVEPSRRAGRLPVITCVPVKVVFSRILESVRGTS